MFSKKQIEILKNTACEAISRACLEEIRIENDEITFRAPFSNSVLILAVSYDEEIEQNVAKIKSSFGRFVAERVLSKEDFPVEVEEKNIIVHPELTCDIDCVIDDEFIKITTLNELSEKQENMNSEEKLSAIKQTAQEIIYLVDKAIEENSKNDAEKKDKAELISNEMLEKILVELKGINEYIDYKKWEMLNNIAKYQALPPANLKFEFLSKYVKKEI